uniref:DUF1549 domain-containing protein n=1 Tax=Schlesneria paludicola TaxID=360056 RepID=A0A7C4LPR8_9PLAN
MRRRWMVCLVGVCGWGMGWSLPLPVLAADKSVPTPEATAEAVDRLIVEELDKGAVPVAPLANDEDFIRRVSFDIIGQPPSPQDVALFGLNPDPRKRSRLIEQLLESPEYGRNWARYWRDVVFLNATSLRGRIGQGTFEAWMAEQLHRNRGWDAIVTDLLTASGNVQENGATALFLAHDAQAAEVAAEACRIFLGIQMQCANCHDHPSDIWKRQQFHELAAYFPRVALRPIVMDGMQRGFEVVSVNFPPGRRGAMPAGPDLFRDPERLLLTYDRNRDGKITKQEAENGPGNGGPFARIFELMLRTGDNDKDGAMSRDELKQLPPPPQQGRASAEYYMPDLNDPSSRGTPIHPKFFVDQSSPGPGLPDAERRAAVAKAFTSPDNPWFARAVINRVWHEMLGEGFYMPVDDLGPTRTPRFPQVLDRLAEGFVAHGYDLKWLIRTVANTQAYQRQVRPKPVSEGALPFAAQTPTRLRADQLFSALVKILGFEERTPAAGAGQMEQPFARMFSPRNQFHTVFTFDPSTPQEDITGNVQQALTMMNSPAFRSAISGTGNTRLAHILRSHTDDQDAICEVYLLALAREPSDRELQLCQQHLRDVGNRSEAFEDLLWSLINSSEFLSKR